MADDPTPITLDSLLPADMAAKAERVGELKASLSSIKLLVLAILAGVFIGFGGLFSVVATTGSLPFGISRLVGGLVFSLGLVLVVIAGAELFTGNTLMVMAVASKRVSWRRFTRALALAFVGNAVGAIVLAAAVIAAGVHEQGSGAVGARLLQVGRTKVDLDIGQAFVLGVLANILVCLAVWLSFSARTVVDRVVAVVGPVAAFVAMGFEHSIANLFLIPAAIFASDHADPSVWTAANGDPAAYSHLTWSRFVVHNLVPVTLGNLVGGSVLVGLVYWFVYLRGSKELP